MRKGTVAFVALCAGAANAQYTVEILHSGLVPAPNSYGAGAGGGQQVGHTNQFLAGPSHALLWEGTANSLVDLHPAGWDASYAMATDGARQVGWRERHTGNTGQFATMWSGSAKGWVDLHNESYRASIALGISGVSQVGSVMEFTSEAIHAALWQGTAASLIDLHPDGMDRSWAHATDGVQQVGYAGTFQSVPRAALWTGTAESYVDLHPSGYSHSEATSVADGQQAGWANLNGNKHAMIWSSSALQFVDLNPGPTTEVGSEVLGTNGQYQVGLTRGFTLTNGEFHASLWSGTAKSWLDLHSLLPGEYNGPGAYSVATGVDEMGRIVGWAYHVPTASSHAVLWTPVPEPSTVILIGLSILFLIFRPRFVKRS